MVYQQWRELFCIHLTYMYAREKDEITHRNATNRSNTDLRTNQEHRCREVSCKVFYKKHVKAKVTFWG